MSKAMNLEEAARLVLDGTGRDLAEIEAAAIERIHSASTVLLARTSINRAEDAGEIDHHRATTLRLQIGSNGPTGSAYRDTVAKVEREALDAGSMPAALLVVTRAGDARIAQADVKRLVTKIGRDGVRPATRRQILMRSARHRIGEIIAEARALRAGGWHQVPRTRLVRTGVVVMVGAMMVAVVAIPSVRSAILDPDLQAYDVARVIEPMTIRLPRDAKAEVAVPANALVIISKLVDQCGSPRDVAIWLLQAPPAVMTSAGLRIYCAPRADLAVWLRVGDYVATTDTIKWTADGRELYAPAMTSYRYREPLQGVTPTRLMLDPVWTDRLPGDVPALVEAIKPARAR